ncbi:MAG: hypothetical protein PHC28_13735 [Flavobacterium sp.]|uniref:hypothetical protein n=1 Tax=Flavobacterium sp. TaxID=239 RepID=UPI00261295BC|nr:hypothetical protein [Flavobacterium sp.]MDD5151514.1 hypothetical protein [Flavobacterium sp.]
MKTQKELYTALLNKRILRHIITNEHIGLCDFDDNIYIVDLIRNKPVSYDPLYDLDPSDWIIDDSILYNQIVDMKEYTTISFNDGKCEIFRMEDHFILFGTDNERKFIDCHDINGIWQLLAKADYYIRDY